jgi:hypothetical protein
MAVVAVCGVTIELTLAPDVVGVLVAAFGDSTDCLSGLRVDANRETWVAGTGEATFGADRCVASCTTGEAEIDANVNTVEAMALDESGDKTLAGGGGSWVSRRPDQRAGGGVADVKTGGRLGNAATLGNRAMDE